MDAMKDWQKPCKKQQPQQAIYVISLPIATETSDLYLLNGNNQYSLKPRVGAQSLQRIRDHESG